MYTQRRRLVLRSPAVALLTAMALALFPAAAQSTDYDGLVTGCAGAAFFDPASLEAAYGQTFQTAPVQTAEEGFRAAYKAISFGKIDHLIYCLDGSEAASGYTSDIPRAADDLEKIGRPTFTWPPTAVLSPPRAASIPSTARMILLQS